MDGSAPTIGGRYQIPISKSMLKNLIFLHFYAINYA